MTLNNLIVSNPVELTFFIGNANRANQALMLLPIHYGYKNLSTGEVFIIEYDKIENELEPCTPIQN